MRRTIALVLALLAVGCSEPSDGAATGAVHNGADVEFLQQMIPHHEQAIVMAEMVPQDAVSMEIAELADEIRAAQAPETARMRAWLSEWKIETDPHAGHSGSHQEDHGMMSADELAALGTATGSDFERRWLTMMIEHHEGAVSMAMAVINGGANPSVRAMAEAIVVGQQSEIQRMTALLANR